MDGYREGEKLRRFMHYYERYMTHKHNLEVSRTVVCEYLFSVVLNTVQYTIYCMYMCRVCTVSSVCVVLT